MLTKKIEELESRIATLEFALKQVENQVNYILSAHGENVPIPLGAPPLKHEVLK
jgi:hypothetical protein